MNNSPEYLLGYQSFKQKPDNSIDFQPLHSSNKRATWKEMDDYIRGWNTAKLEHIRGHAQLFVIQLQRIQQEFGAKVLTGCGCCGAGYYITIDGIEYSFLVKDGKVVV